MKFRSKRYKSACAKLEGQGSFPLEGAVAVLKTLDSARFDETVEVSINLGIDPRKSDQLIRGSFSLPHGTGKTRRVIAFAEGDNAKQAEDAGAVEVGGMDLVEKIQEGWMDFDVAVSTPAMMRHVRKLGRVLGPQGKMPSPKAGTVAEDVARAVRDFIAGKIEFRVDPGAVLHVPVGRKSFPAEHLVENIDAFLSHLSGQRPATAKGTFLRKITLSPTMGPGVDVNLGKK